MNPAGPFSFDDETLQRLMAYIDGTLDATERDALERDLAADDALRAELEAMRRLDDAIRTAGKAAPELDWDRFSLEAQRRREEWDAKIHRPLVFRIYQPLAAAAAIAIVITAGVLMRSDETPETAVVPTPVQSAVAVVTVDRSGPVMEAAKPRIAVVRVSHELPDDALATVGPAPHGRTLVVTVGGEAGSGAEQYDEDDAAFF